MENRLGNKIEKLGLSKSACEELRKCHIDTIQDLMLLINEKLVENQDEARHTEENVYIANYPYSIPLNKAIPDVLRFINGPFDYRIVREKLRKRYGKKVTMNKSSIKTSLNQLLREGILKQTETGDYIHHLNKNDNEFSTSPESDRSVQNRIHKEIELDLFLQDHIGKEIEFRYQSERPSSSRRWRRETVWMHDDKYLYITKQYLSGRHVFFLKNRIVEYRETK